MQLFHRRHLYPPNPEAKLRLRGEPEVLAIDGEARAACDEGRDRVPTSPATGEEREASGGLVGAL